MEGIPGLAWSSVLKPTWPCDSIGIDCLWTISGRLFTSFLGAKAMATISGGNLDRVWTPIRIVSGLFYPPLMAMAGLDLARNAFNIATTTLHLPWFLPQSSSGASAALASGELAAAQKALKSNESVFWTNAKSILTTRQSDLKSLMNSKGVNTQRLQGWFKGGNTAANIRDFGLACRATSWHPDDSTIQTVLTEMHQCYSEQANNVTGYLKARQTLETEAGKAQAQQTALAATKGARVEAVQVGGIRRDLVKSILGTVFSTCLASMFAMNALSSSFITQYGNKLAFATQVMGPALKDSGVLARWYDAARCSLVNCPPGVLEAAEGTCQAMSAASWLANSPILIKGTQALHWGLGILPAAVTTVQVGLSFKNGWREGVKTSIYGLATALALDLLPSNVTAAIGMGRYAIYGAYCFEAIPHFLHSIFDATEAQERGDDAGFNRGIQEAFAPLQFGMQIMGLKYVGSSVSSGLNLVGRTLTQGWHCALLSVMPEV